MLYYTNTVRGTLHDLDTSENGLAASIASERLRTHGPNTIQVTGDPLWRKLFEPFANVFVLVLFIAIIISILHGAILDAVIIGIIILSSAVIYYIQRFSTERILRALRKHQKQTVHVMRDGKHISIDATQLVPGDIITLSEGEKIPADARVIACNSLRIDESQLTGESEPITKQTEPLKHGKQVYEQTNMLFQGSFVVSGTATAAVTVTGNGTQFGQLAALTADGITRSPVQQKIDKLITRIIAVVAAVAVAAFALSLYRGLNLSESFSFVIAISVSAVPESLPVAISVILVLGMRRMAAKKALVRSMGAIETVGVITTIATDKTGTLTKNKLTVQDAWHPDMDETSFAKLVARSINHTADKTHDPLDTALHDFALEHMPTKAIHVPMLSMPFDQATAMSGNIWHRGEEYDLIVKGAPEQVIARSSLTDNEREKVTNQLHKLTSDGHRVIGLAHAPLKKPIKSLAEITHKHNLEFAGFVAVADVLRPEAKRAIAIALKAGVTVRMITGDHFETAFQIGKQLGMVRSRDQVFDSRRMHVMNDDELEKIIEHTMVFSRVIPEHKHRILALLNKHNITAMTGDGVNDVPALTNAHVGIAMGSGASIAKDAGDIILIDNNFKSIVDAMREGRTIFANIRRMLYYLLSTNTGEVLTMVGALAIGLPLPLAPVQILWINLVTDTTMVIPLGLEAGEKSAMKQKPLSPQAPILNKIFISRMVLVALTMAALTIGIYALFSSQYGHTYGSTLAFTSLVAMQWSNAFNARSDEESVFKRLKSFNGKFYLGLVIGVVIQGLVIFTPLGSVLHITPVAIGDLFMTSVTAFTTLILVVEVHKWIIRNHLSPIHKQ